MAKTSKAYTPDPTATAISKMFNVSTRYVRMIRDGERINKIILDAYQTLKANTAEVIEQTRLCIENKN